MDKLFWSLALSYLAQNRACSYRLDPTAWMNMKSFCGRTMFCHSIRSKKFNWFIWIHSSKRPLFHLSRSTIWCMTLLPGSVSQCCQSTCSPGSLDLTSLQNCHHFRSHTHTSANLPTMDSLANNGESSHRGTSCFCHCHRISIKFLCWQDSL